MLDRTSLLGLAIAGLLLTTPLTQCHAESPAIAGISAVSLNAVEDAGKKDKEEKDADDEKDGDKKDEQHEGKEKKEIEQSVPMNMVPSAVMDAVKKEVPGGTITEAELEAKKGKIMYSFDVKTADAAYDVKITVDGKFFSKKVDDEANEKDDKGVKDKKPAAPDKD